MEIILAIVVASAVIVFGALISIGNERQRRAIDSLREQVVNWAVQDLKIKRGQLTCDVKVTDPLDWLCRVAMKAGGAALKRQHPQVLHDPVALLFTTEHEDRQAVFTTTSPVVIHRMKQRKQSRLKSFSDPNPLLSSTKGVQVVEINMLTNDILFDLELPLVWNQLTGQSLESTSALWLYLIP